MTPLTFGAVLALGMAFVGAVAATRRRGPSLAARVGPYRPGPGSRDGVRVGAVWSPPRPSRWAGRPARPDEGAAEELRIRQFAQAGLGAVVGGAIGGAVLRSPVLTLVLAGSGAFVGFTRGPARRARMAEAHRARMRLELVTIDQVLAIHVRSGAGPVQAITRVVERGHGVVVDELRAVLASVRAGRGEAEAFRHAARSTPEPHAARTYRLFALAAEQGADLGTALRALSDDLRDVRRDELRRQATRRRAAMLVPTIAVLAPIMLLFVIAPLPALVLGGR